MTLPLSHLRSSLFYGFSLLGLAEGKLWHSIVVPSLPAADSAISFDPLGVAAILNNPRAFACASRLYTQRDIDLFRWPPLAMIGATLPPVSCLVEHLASRTTSIHPALTLALTNQEKLTVASDTIFKELPVNFSNIWMTDVLTFPSSDKPQHDIMIVRLESFFGGVRPGVRTWPSCIYLNLLGMTSALLTAAGVLFSALYGDMWAVALFFTYLCHWFASKLVSMHPLVAHHRPDRPIPEDSTMRHAIYKRPEGGFVIFKGHQDVIETWARTTWYFCRTPLNTALHWNWMITGFLAALASVVCMVNMAGYLQLGFLAVLFYSSVAEILATQCARSITSEARFFGHTDTALGNETWSKAIVRATLEVNESCRLNELDWIKLGYLPDFQVFRNLQNLLQQWDDKSEPSKFDDIVDYILTENCTGKQMKLANRIAEEVRSVIDSRSNHVNEAAQISSTKRRLRALLFV